MWVGIMKRKTITQTSHIEYTPSYKSHNENPFCILCGLVGIVLFIIGWVMVTFFPIT
jgi:hypothetical protein